jgi:hypothetical protein
VRLTKPVKASEGLGERLPVDYGHLELKITVALVRQWVEHARARRLFTKEACTAHTSAVDLWAVVQRVYTRLHDRRADLTATARLVLARLRHVQPDALERRARRPRKVYAVSLRQPGADPA